MGIHATVLGWIEKILQDHESLVSIAVRQRGRFEAWLKYELADHMQRNGASDVEVEARAKPEIGVRHHYDIAFALRGVRYNLELKTPATNYAVRGVAKKTRAFTRAIRGIVKDAKTLAKSAYPGVVAFVMSPIVSRGQGTKHLKDIGAQLRICLSETEHAKEIPVSLGKGLSAEILVVCFEVPGEGRHGYCVRSSSPDVPSSKKETSRGKYAPLRDYLAAYDGQSMVLRFQDIESILDKPLPAAARVHREWWANDATHVQARAWMTAGFKVAKLDIRLEQVSFVRSS